MAEKANDEVYNIPSVSIANLPTLLESLTERKKRKEDLDEEALSEQSLGIAIRRPHHKVVFPKASEDELEERWIEMESTADELESTADELNSTADELNSTADELEKFIREREEQSRGPRRISKFLRVFGRRHKREREEQRREPENSDDAPGVSKFIKVLDKRQDVSDKRQNVLNNRERVLEKRERVLDKRQDVLNNRERDQSVPKIKDLAVPKILAPGVSKFIKELESSEDELESSEDVSEEKMRGHIESSFEDEEACKIHDLRSLQTSFKAEDESEIYKPRDDDEELDPFLCSGKVKNIKTLIESGRLPRQRILDEMCQMFGRKSQEITITCKAICEQIKSKHAAIAYVWAAYTIQNPHKITFVVILKHKSEGDTSTEPLDLDKLITYSFVNQYVGEFSSEGPDVQRQQTSASEGLDEESYQKLQSCISKHSEVLMKKHKFLSIISACSNRSKGFGASWKLLPEKCIVLYVQTKNFIPIDEEPFETNYDGIPVDVREGAFIPFGRTAKDLLDPVKMGSQIGGDIYKGTLGFFIDHPQFGICGLTCAHVLLTRWEMTQLKTNHSGTLKWPLHRMCKNVYQPADKRSVLGHTVQVIYKEGSDENCGMELALFRITDRHPKSPSFPDETGSNVATSIIYDSWRMCSTDRLNKKEDAKVMKFGSNTELSYGIIKFDTISVKSLDAYPLVHEYAPIQLFKQIEVQALSNGTPFAKEGDSGSNGTPFAKEGDSGAPVFVVEKNSQNKCLGIIEGGTTYGTVVVTPIVPILAELDVPCLKSFDTEKELSNIQNKIENLETRVQTFGSDIRSINSNMQTVNHEIQNINRSLTVDLPKMSGDMQAMKELLENLTQNFNSSSANSQKDQHGHD